jgi:hypothetical protein
MMGDACLCIDVDNDGGYVLEESVVIARIDHVCGECHCQINVGDKYESASIVYDGNIETHKTCITCLNMRNDLFSCGWYYGEIWEDLRQHFDEVLACDDEYDGDDWKWLKG